MPGEIRGIAFFYSVLFSFYPETPKQCYPPLGWGFPEVSRPALWQDGDRKESA